MDRPSTLKGIVGILDYESERFPTERLESCTLEQDDLHHQHSRVMRLRLATLIYRSICSPSSGLWLGSEIGSDELAMLAPGHHFISVFAKFRR